MDHVLYVGSSVSYVFGALLLVVFPRMRVTFPMTCWWIPGFHVVAAWLSFAPNGLEHTAPLIATFYTRPFDPFAARQMLQCGADCALFGWFGFMALDMFLASWILRDAQREGIRHLFVVPILVVTLNLGSLGLLAYLTCRRLVVGTLVLERT